MIYFRVYLPCGISMPPKVESWMARCSKIWLPWSQDTLTSLHPISKTLSFCVGVRHSVAAQKPITWLASSHPSAFVAPCWVLGGIQSFYIQLFRCPNKLSCVLLSSDPPSQPTLSMDPPSGVVSEGHPLLITCVAPEEEGKFHFYKDGSEIVPGDAGAEINITDTRTDPKNSSVLSISEARHSNAGEFSCGYEAVVGGRWIPSPKSQPVTVTVKGKAVPESKFWNTKGVLNQEWTR